jgi:hypothetical protein
MPKSRRVWLGIGFVLLGFLLYFGYRIYELSRPPFLTDDFVIAHRMRMLPPSARQAFTVTGGHRLTMADPNEDFEATDAILFPGMPRKRLIFAGVSGDKCFVHFEAGGIVHSYEGAFFRLSQASQVEPIWAGYCAEAKVLADLRNQIEHGDCESQ